MAVLYAPDLCWLKTNGFMSIDEQNFVKRLEVCEPTYEMTGSENNVCNMYFDIDISTDDFNDTINKIVGETGLKYVKNCIMEVLGVEPNIAMATSSSAKFIDWKKKKEMSKYSWRYFVNNVKMVKKEMKEFIKVMNDYIVVDSDIYDYVENKGGLFDTGIYDDNRKMRCVGTSKPGENRPLVLVQGTIADTIITSNSNSKAILCHYEVKTSPKIQIPISPTSVTSNIDSDEISELLNIIGKKGKREKWLKLCSWFISNSTKEAFLNWVDIAWRDEAEKMYDSLAKNPRPCSMYALHNMAKDKDENAYKDWRGKYQKYITFELLNKGSNDVARFVAPRLKENLIYCNEEWIQYDNTSHLWRTVKRPDTIIITHIQREIDEAREAILAQKNRCDNEEQRKEFGKLEKWFADQHHAVSSGGYVSQIIRFLTDYLFDADFIKLLDNHPYKVAFKNGMLDLRTLKLREGLFQSDYLTKTIPFNYVEKNDNDVDVINVRIALKKICNWNEAHLDYYLSCIGYSMIGDSTREQMFWYYRGQTAENGKSSVLEALEEIMPNYVIKGTNTFLDKGVELKKEVPTWKGKRIVWLNELSTKVKDEDIVKSICDGTDFKYNRNYATEAQKVPINFKLFVVSNNSMNIKGDAGVKRRFKLCQFNSQFQEITTEDNFETLQFKKDKDFGKNLSGIYRDALLYLIFSYSKKYADDKCLRPYPSEWKEESDENMADNNKFEQWFHDNFEVGSKETHKISRIELQSLLPTEFKTINIKDELTKMKVSYNYDSKKNVRIGTTTGKGMYEGFKIKPIPETKSIPETNNDEIE